MKNNMHATTSIYRIGRYIDRTGERGENERKAQMLFLSLYVVLDKYISIVIKQQI